MANEVLKLEQPRATDSTPLQMLQSAIERGLSADTLKQLMDLQREWKADQAREAFVEAMNGFRGEAIKITKRKPVSYKANEVAYKYAPLASVLTEVVPKLSAHGLSHRWETKQDGSTITVTCIITHRLGHSEQATLSSGPDASGGKNGIQAIGSATAYLQRYTFMAATGLAAEDDDGRGTGTDEEKITPSQAADLEALIQEVGANKASFLRMCKVDSIDQIPAKAYTEAVKRVEAKRK